MPCVEDLPQSALKSAKGKRFGLVVAKTPGVIEIVDPTTGDERSI